MRDDEKKVYEYKQRPMICRICLEYGHGKQFCEKEQKRGRCGNVGHDKVNCRSKAARCYHCGEGHEVGHRSCVEERYQQEIVSVQTRQRVSRYQAKAIVDREIPHIKTRNYAESVEENSDAGNKIGGQGARGKATTNEEQELIKERSRVEEV